MLSPKLFYRRVEALLDRVASGAGAKRFAVALLPALLDEFGAPLGVSGAQLYERAADGWRLKRGAGDASGSATPAAVASALDPARGALEPPVLLGEWGLIAADGRVLALHFTDELTTPPGQRMLWLSALQHAFGERLQRSELEDLVEQARVIQTSLLPAAAPRFGDYDIATVATPARVVGGDAHDFILLEDDTLALAVADASGHGLPAALQARDVVVGLRMGVERDLKITRMVEKLNRVIHASGLSSRFVSLVFGELELNGNFTYINAGHPPPLLVDERGVHELTVGGLVLGPDVSARYKQGFAHLDRGAAMVLYSDGVIEHGDARGEMFGEDGLRAWLVAWRDGPADAAVADLVSRLKAHGGAAAFEDDVTIVYVRRARSEEVPAP
jgi:stage II sporulation SpoE-like protein